MHLFDWLVRGRVPNLTIGPKHNPQTERYHLFRWRGLQLALHKWHRSDDDRALHDHSSWNVSLILWGSYLEVFNGRTVRRWPLIPYGRRGATPHRIMLCNRDPVWTLWLRGRPWREWGFHCAKGWVHWKDYTSTRDYSAVGSTSEVGKGCG